MSLSDVFIGLRGACRQINPLSASRTLVNEPKSVWEVRRKYSKQWRLICECDLRTSQFVSGNGSAISSATIYVYVCTGGENLIKMAKDFSIEDSINYEARLYRIALDCVWRKSKSYSIYILISFLLKSDFPLLMYT